MLTPALSDRASSYGKAATWPAIRSDAAIEEDIWQHLQKEYHLGPACANNIEVEVKNGNIHLTGHLPTLDHCDLAGRIASRVRGVTWVQNNIVPDEFLQQQVIKALAESGKTAAYMIPARCAYGWVSLGGLVPTDEVALAAEAAVSRIPMVRGILSLPTLIYDSLGPEILTQSMRRPIQPRLNAAVYSTMSDTSSAYIGFVSQVILDPVSRLVTHFAVKPGMSTSYNGSQADRVIPIQDVEAASSRSVWLCEGIQADWYPEFDPKEYPPSPKDWQPPFPYQPGALRWSWKEI